MTTAVAQSTPHDLPVPVAAGPRAFSRPEVAFLIGVPLLWGTLLLFHPVGDEYYDTAADAVTRWQTVHIGTMLFVPLMACVMLLLLRGVEGTAARVSRFALPVFAVFYAAWEILVGIGTGLLVDDVNDLPASERATGIDLIDEFVDSRINAVFNAIGTAAWLVAAVAAAVALSRGAQGRRSVWVVVLLVLSSPLIAMHVTPFGPVGLGLFIGALLLVVRDRPAPVVELGAPV